MARALELDELVEFFTLLPDETVLLRNKSGATRLGFALLLKVFAHRGRFPSGRAELPSEAVEFVAKQVRYRRPSWASTTGPGGRSRPTAPRSVGSWGSGSAVSATR